MICQFNNELFLADAYSIIYINGRQPLEIHEPINVYFWRTSNTNLEKYHYLQSYLKRHSFRRNFVNKST